VSLVSRPCSADDIKSELRRRHLGLSHVTIEIAVCRTARQAKMPKAAKAAFRT